MAAALLYERLAERLRGQIQRGVLRSGERLPSLRQLGREQRVSLATAVEAYLQLEREGLIEARPRSGYYVRAPSVPAPRSIAAMRGSRTPQPVRNRALLGVLDVLARDDLLPLHAATPSLDLLPAAALSAATVRALRRAPDVALRYAPPQGLAPLREHIAHRYAQCEVEVDADEIIVTAGAMEAIGIALRTVTQPGDVVLVETPTYHGLLQLVAALKLQVVEVPNRCGRGIDTDCLSILLERHDVRAAVLVPNFNNPVGSLTDDVGKRALVAACAAHGVVVIEDDLYGELAYSGERPAPLRRFDAHDNVITCGSYSKMLAPGLRVGWVFGARWTAELLRAKCFSTMATATLPQLAIAEYLSRHDFDRGLRRLRRELAANAQRYRQAIAEHWPAGTCASEPAGGLSLWVELPALVEGQTLFEAALARGIGTLPGHLFSSRGDYRHHLRLSCGLPWSVEVERALRTLGKLARQQAG
ncbi:MAG TPA: PLP-dependent aminotransferase family protein [Lysobacter sp.]